MRYLGFLLVWLMLGALARADGLFELKSVSIDAKSYFQGGVDPMLTYSIPNRTLGNELNLAISTDVLNYFYWNNTVVSATDRVLNSDGSTSPGQFRMVGLEMTAGVDLRRFEMGLPFTFGYYHLSRHQLDAQYPWPFPRGDAVQLKIFLYEGHR